MTMIRMLNLSAICHWCLTCSGWAASWSRLDLNIIRLKLCHMLTTLGTRMLDIPGLHIRRVTIWTSIQKTRDNIWIISKHSRMKFNRDLDQWLASKAMPCIDRGYGCFIRSIPNICGIPTGMTFILWCSTQVYPQLSLNVVFNWGLSIELFVVGPAEIALPWGNPLSEIPVLKNQQNRNYLQIWLIFPVIINAHTAVIRFRAYWSIIGELL